jgi:hypothetical protein
MGRYGEINNMKRLKKVYFYWSATEVHSAKFVRWCRMRMCTGSTDTNKIGIGVVVESEFLFGKWTKRPVPYGLKRNQDRIRPYTILYRTYSDARRRKRAIRKPKMRYVRN